VGVDAVNEKIQIFFGGRVVAKRKAKMTAERKAWRKGLAGRLRTLVGRNEAEFARQIGIEPATFNTYTTGKTAPPVYVIWRVSQVTGCDLNVLVAGSAREAPAGGVQ